MFYMQTKVPDGSEFVSSHGLFVVSGHWKCSHHGVGSYLPCFRQSHPRVPP